MALFSVFKKLLGSFQSQGESPITIDESAIVPRAEHNISRADISSNAIKVLTRLNKAGYQACLVGGSVRDLLLHHKPKDFDIATNAKPEQVRSLFKNCRLIGRRFRLAHILFGREIIEVATFRRGVENPTNNDHKHRSGMLIRDNVYGNIKDDAFRRDFTINALYYHIADQCIIDLTGGVADIKARTLRIIGKPEERYREDPVRMIRAIRFAAKLDFSIDPKTAAPIAKMVNLLSHVPHSRLFEEVIKLFHGGYGQKVWQQLEAHHMHTALFPSLESYLQANHPHLRQMIECTLRNTDNRIMDKKPVTPAFLFAALLWYPLLELSKAHQDEGFPALQALERAMNDIIVEQCQRTTIPRRFTRVMREMWLLQYRFTRRSGGRAYRILNHPRFRASYDLLLLRAEVGEENKQLAEWWTEFQDANAQQREAMVKAVKPRRRRRKRSK